MRQERHVNNAQTTLQGTIGSGDTSIVVADGSVFPSEGDFRIVIDFELMLVTARSGNTLTVVREIESTVAASHNDAVDVKAVVTEGALEKFWEDHKGTYIASSSLPNRLFTTTGTPATEASFTWFNQGTATADDLDDGSILLTTPAGSGNNWRGKYVTPPSTPWTVTAAFTGLWLQNGSTYPQFGIAIENSNDGKLVCFSKHHRGGQSPGLQLVKMNSYTSYNSSYIDLRSMHALTDLFWMRVENDGVNHKFSISIDGVEWLLIHTVAYDDYLTNGGDRVGWGHDISGNNVYSTDHLTYVKHWSWS